MEAIELVCDICGKPLATEKGLKIHMTWHGKKSEAEQIDQSPYGRDADLSEETDEIRPVSIYDEEASPVEPAKKGWREKMWGPSSSPAGRPSTSPAEKRPRKRRVSTEGIWTTAWTGAGVALQRTGADVPVGRCMQFQAPIVGDILDEAIAGTFVDTLLQPIAGSGKRFKKVSSVVSLPILVGLIERNPAAAPMLEPLLREVLRENLVALAASAKKVRREEEQYRKAMEDLGMEVGDDPIDSLLADIFSAPPGAPETNGNGAPKRDSSGKFVRAE